MSEFNFFLLYRSPLPVYAMSTDLNRQNHRHIYSITKFQAPDIFIFIFFSFNNTLNIVNYHNFAARNQKYVYFLI